MKAHVLLALAFASLEALAERPASLRPLAERPGQGFQTVRLSLTRPLDFWPELELFPAIPGRRRGCR